MPSIDDLGNITMNGGESVPFTLRMKNIKYQDQVFLVGDVVVIAVGRCCPKQEPIYTKTITVEDETDALLFEISADESALFPKGSYKYDVMIRRDDEVQKIIPLKDFFVNCSVSAVKNEEVEP